MGYQFPTTSYHHIQNVMENKGKSKIVFLMKLRNCVFMNMFILYWGRMHQCRSNLLWLYPSVKRRNISQQLNNNGYRTLVILVLFVTCFVSWYFLLYLLLYQYTIYWVGASSSPVAPKKSTTAPYISSAWRCHWPNEYTIFLKILR